MRDAHTAVTLGFDTLSLNGTWAQPERNMASARTEYGLHPSAVLVEPNAGRMRPTNASCELIVRA